MSRAGAITKDTERGTWTLVVDIGQPGGRRRQVKRRGFPTKKAAQAERDAIVESVRSGQWVEPDRRTLGPYLDAWVKRLPVEGLAPATVAQYRDIVKLYVQPYAIAEVALQSVSAVDLDDLYAELMDRKLSARTVRLVHTVVRRALGDAVAKGVLTRNPADVASPPSRKASRRKELTVWTPGELRSVLGHLNLQDGYHTAVAVLAATGLRRSEALGLWWSDIDLDEGRLTVRRTVVSVSGTATVQHLGKTDHSLRAVDMGPATVAMLRAWRKEQVRQRLALGAGWRGSDPFVCTTTVGTMLDPRKVAHRLDQLAKAADVPRIRVHDLRHTHATHLLAAGVNPKVVSERLGHASVSFTLDVYGHVMPTQQAEAADAVERLVFG